MAGHEWDWFQREELIGQISDIRVQNLQDLYIRQRRKNFLMERRRRWVPQRALIPVSLAHLGVERENVQKRTFTRWVNLHLEKCCPPLEVKDLFVDIQDGRILMALLEVLTGHSLLHEYKSSSHRIFRLNNIAKALQFLEDSNVKLVSIDAAEIADGNPSLVLGLIWNIILFLQIKELTGHLNSMASPSSSSSLPAGTDVDVSQAGTASVEKSLSTSFKDQRKAIKALLSWVQRRTRRYGVAVQDFAGSWRSGLAFLAVIKSIDSSLVDMKSALERSPRENLEDAFTIAQHSLNIPRLLELEDVMVDAPDEHSIMTYVTQFLEHFPEMEPDDLSAQAEDAPVEMTFVHYKDGPREEASKIITLPKNEDEDMDITVELQTRPLTPPQSHVYTEVDVTGESRLSGTFQGSEVRADGSFNLDGFPPQLETSSLNLNVSSNGLNGGGFENSKVGVSGGDQEPFLLSNRQGALDRDHPDTGPPNATESGDKEQDVASILSHNSSKYSDSSSSFSSMSDRDSTDLSSQSEGYQPGEDSPKSSPVSDDSGLVTPHEEGEDFKYILHLPNSRSPGDPSKQRTVFQAYRGSSEDRPRSTDSTGEDAKSSAKISVIPHDLFYYPHYSVPIADVLHAFTDSHPQGTLRSPPKSEASSDIHTDTTFSGDEDWEEGNAGNVDHPAVEGDVAHEDNMKPGSAAPLLGSLTNATASEPTRDTQGHSMVTRSGYHQHSQVPAQTGEPDPINSRWDAEEEGPAELAAAVVGGVTDQRFASNQSEQRAAGRKELQLHKDSESADLKEENTELYKHQTAALSNINGSSADVTCSTFQELGGLFHLGLLLWFLCYCAMILPELDMDNVAFFAHNN